MNDTERLAALLAEIEREAELAAMRVSVWSETDTAPGIPPRSPETRQAIVSGYRHQAQGLCNLLAWMEKLK